MYIVSFIFRKLLKSFLCGLQFQTLLIFLIKALYTVFLLTLCLKESVIAPDQAVGGVSYGRNTQALSTVPISGSRGYINKP